MYTRATEWAREARTPEMGLPHLAPEGGEDGTGVDAEADEEVRDDDGCQTAVTDQIDDAPTEAQRSGGKGHTHARHEVPSGETPDEVASAEGEAGGDDLEGGSTTGPIDPIHDETAKEGLFDSGRRNRHDDGEELERIRSPPSLRQSRDVADGVAGVNRRNHEGQKPGWPSAPRSGEQPEIAQKEDVAAEQLARKRDPEDTGNEKHEDDGASFRTRAGLRNVLGMARVHRGLLRGLSGLLSWGRRLVSNDLQLAIKQAYREVERGILHPPHVTSVDPRTHEVGCSQGQAAHVAQCGWDAT